MEIAQQRIRDWTHGTVLNLCGLELTELPPLPAGLQRLYCYNNRLTTLPELPAELERLWCFNNQLTILPNLPAGLQVLGCSNNNLTTLPELPDGLRELYCQGNHLRVLPTLPVGLRRLDDSNNLFSARRCGETIVNYNRRMEPLRLEERLRTFKTEAWDRRSAAVALWATAWE